METFLSLLSCRYIITHGSSCLLDVEKKSKTHLLRRPPSTATLWQTDFLRAVSRAIARFGVVRHPSSICLDSWCYASALRSPVGWRAVYSQSLLTLSVYFFVWYSKWDAYVCSVTAEQLPICFTIFIKKNNKYY